MKKLILVMAVVLTATIGWASGWDNVNGLSTNPILAGYYSSIYSNTILPLTANTGWVGLAANKFDAVNADTVRGRIEPTAISGTGNWTNSNGSISAYDIVSITLGGKGRVYNTATNGWLSVYSSNANPYVWLSDTTANDTTRGWFVGKYAIRGKATGSSVSADTGKFMTIKTAKDTCLEVALFTRTCTRDTLTFMSGVDSLTAAYIVTPFATRGAISIPPYIAGVVGGKLVVDRPEADTADYDRYSVTKIMQR